jgi:hypothetical protein
MKKIVNKDELMIALQAYDVQLMKFTNYIHLRIDSDGKPYITEDTSYCISADEFNQREGAPITVLSGQGYGNWDSESYETPEDQAHSDDAYEQHCYYADQIYANYSDEIREDN